MKACWVVLGMATGAVAATATIAMTYPDVYRRMMRDGKRIVKKGKRFAKDMGMM